MYFCFRGFTAAERLLQQMGKLKTEINSNVLTNFCLGILGIAFK